MTDIRECWGTAGLLLAGLDVGNFYQEIDLPYHGIGHLYCAALLDGVPDGARTVLAFAVEGGPDFDLDVRLLEHWYFGGVFRGGDVEMFPSAPIPSSPHRPAGWSGRAAPGR